MTEIIRIDLENEMDLILAHKRSMKLAELCGASVLKQTSFATAVSEISRCVIGRDGYVSKLVLGINNLRGNRKELLAVLSTPMELGREHDNSIKYARRLADSLKIARRDDTTEATITEKINFSGLLNEARIESFIGYFKRETPLSPYDEIRKKNIQLLELSEKLKESEDQYRRLTETLPLMIFTTNASGYLTYGNQWLKDHFGLGEIQPGKLLWLSLLDAGEHKTAHPLWEKSQLGKSPLRIQARLRAKPGSEPLWHMVFLMPLESEEQQLVGWTGFFADIHAQKLVEETLKNNVELKAAQKQLLSYQAKLENNLKELNKSNHDLEQFAYIASHDLQEPLRKMRSYVELLNKGIEEHDKVRKYSEKIEQSSSRMSDLIKGVLNYSRLSKAEAVFEEVDLKKVLGEVKTDLELLIDDKKAELTCTGLPVIIGIPQQLHQLFYNLVGNALKFNNGQPVISVVGSPLPHEEVQRYDDLHTSVRYVKIAVKDNGIGFDQRYADDIFTIFKRLNPKEMFEGTGIGLSLCKKIVDNHHGVISAQSEPGKGTKFTMILPVA